MIGVGPGPRIWSGTKNQSGGVASCWVIHNRLPERALKQKKPDVHLTTREEEVLILLSKGYANKEIADKLSISAETVGSHLKHIYEKMHVRSRTEAVARYMTSKA